MPGGATAGHQGPSASATETVLSVHKADDPETDETNLCPRDSVGSGAKLGQATRL